MRSLSITDDYINIEPVNNNNKIFKLMILFAIYFSILFFGLYVYYTFRKITINPIDNSELLQYKKFNISINIEQPNLLNYAIYYLTDTSERPTCKLALSKNIKVFREYDRGHIIPKNDIDDCSTNIKYNYVPQIPCFNRGIWRKLEEYIHNNFKKNFILTVPEYKLVSSNIINYFGNINQLENHVPIGFYKIVISPTNNLIYSIYLEHNQDNCYKNFENVGIYNKLPDFVSFYLF